MPRLDLELRNKPFNDISYIRVLEFAANKAIGLGLSDRSDDFNKGFTFEDIKTDKNCGKIKDSWLKEILPSICTVRKDEEEIEITAITDKEKEWHEYYFIIKSDEFIKFATLISLNKTHKSLWIAIAAIFIAIVTQIFQEDIRSHIKSIPGYISAENSKQEECLHD